MSFGLALGILAGALWFRERQKRHDVEFYLAAVTAERDALLREKELDKALARAFTKELHGQHPRP